jgi:uncharacterized protein involved in exopolysaccharide biosynthesis
MSQSPPEHGYPPERIPQPTGERLVYVMPEQLFDRAPSETIGLRELSDILWRGKWTVLAVTALVTLAAAAYALLATEWYRAEVLLAPAEERSTPSLGGQLGQLGGLAALAGVTVGGGDSGDAIATLGSRGFARDFIEDYGLLTVFFADQWDAEADRWRSDNPRRWPDIRDAVQYFHDHVLTIHEDRASGRVRVEVEWTDPELAAEWADALVTRLNASERARALREAQANVAYLQSELSRTTLITLQDSIGRVLESEMQKLMLARGNEEFAFRIIDAANPPRYPVRPQRALVIVIGALIGAMLGAFGVLLAHMRRTEHSRKKAL